MNPGLLQIGDEPTWITEPALFAMPLAFLLGYVFSITDKSERAGKERAAYADQWVRAQTGFGADGAVSH